MRRNINKIKNKIWGRNGWKRIIVLFFGITLLAGVNVFANDLVSNGRIIPPSAGYCMVNARDARYFGDLPHSEIPTNNVGATRSMFVYSGFGVIGMGMIGMLLLARQRTKSKTNNLITSV